MSRPSSNNNRRPARGAERKTAMPQVAAVGFAFAGSLLLAGLAFLPTNRGGQDDAIWIFPLWAVLFFALIWKASGLQQIVARGLALLGAELLALPLAWLLYQGLPSLRGDVGPIRQTLPVFALGLIAGAALLGGSLLVSHGAGLPATPVRRALLALAGLVFTGEAVYGVVLLMRLLSA